MVFTANHVPIFLPWHRQNTLWTKRCLTFPINLALSFDLFLSFGFEPVVVVALGHDQPSFQDGVEEGVGSDDTPSGDDESSSDTPGGESTDQPEEGN